MGSFDGDLAALGEASCDPYLWDIIWFGVVHSAILSSRTYDRGGNGSRCAVGERDGRRGGKCNEQRAGADIIQRLCIHPSVAVAAAIVGAALRTRIRVGSLPLLVLFALEFQLRDHGRRRWGAEKEGDSFSPCRSPRDPHWQGVGLSRQTARMAPVELADPVTIDYGELSSASTKDLFPRLRDAFGDEPDCLGMVLIDMQSVPEYVTLRIKLLSYSSYLAGLPKHELKKLENAHAKYVVGWSHGKEKLATGAADTRKGLRISRRSDFQAATTRIPSMNPQQHLMT